MIKYGYLLTVLWIISLPVNAEQVLRLSTTTSTENSGLLAILNPIFERLYDARVDVIAVGTGKALRIGANGDVDVVFVHAPAAEMAYVKRGDFIDRQAVMHNDFVIVGPVEDSADVKNAQTAVEAMQKIAVSEASFISRGDDSGTHKKELQLWKQAETKPEGVWYTAVGQGMGAVLRIADEKQAYTLTDRGTLLAYSDKLAIKLLFAGDSAIFNPYHVMAVNPEKFKQVNYPLAKKYIDFLTGAQGQKLIADFKKAGQQLFYPDAIP